MSQEKKPRKVVAKKDVTKKSVEVLAEAPMVEAAPKQAAPAGRAAKTRVKTATKAKPKAGAKSIQVNLEDLIRLRAYEIYLRRGATPGNPHEDWQVAEREVREHFGAEMGQEAEI